MTKNTLSTIYSALLDAGYESTDPIMTEIEKELNRGASKNAQKMAEYDAAWEVVSTVFDQTTAALTASEIFDSIAKVDLPDGFTKGKLTYALTHYWVDRVVKVEGKVNTYRKR